MKITDQAVQEPTQVIANPLRVVRSIHEWLLATPLEASGNAVALGTCSLLAGGARENLLCLLCAIMAVVVFAKATRRPPKLELPIEVVRAKYRSWMSGVSNLSGRN